MKKLSEFLKKYKKPLIWSICYTCAMWAILYFLFNFDIFNSTQWHRLAHSQLRGFPGFVFGILILSAIPLYVATTVIVTRKDEYLITLPQVKIPNIIKTKKIEPKQPEPEQPEQKQSEPEQPNIPDEVPHEIRNIYARALRNLEALQFNTPEPNSNTTDTQSDTNDNQEPLPLPSDFDISFTDVPGFDNESDETIPVFTDINFNTTEEPDEDDNSPEHTFDNSTVIAHLKKSGQKYTVNNNVVTTDKFSIITHSDTDFWVPDQDNWFATGKSCPSPIAIIKSAAKSNNTRPVIYLEAQNIMNLETLIPQWESDGIIVITDINKL